MEEDPKLQLWASTCMHTCIYKHWTMHACTCIYTTTTYTKRYSVATWQFHSGVQLESQDLRYPRLDSNLLRQVTLSSIFLFSLLQGWHYRHVPPHQVIVQSWGWIPGLQACLGHTLLTELHLFPTTQYFTGHNFKNKSKQTAMITF